MSTHILLANRIRLRDFDKGDEEILTKNINYKLIYENSLHIPFPYTPDHAKKWIDFTLKLIKKKPSDQLHFAIDMDAEIIGGIGLHNIHGHKCEIGYWLSPAFWGQGIMTEVLKTFTSYIFLRLKLQRISALVFEHNIGSIKVLRKAGYEYEGTLRKYLEKDGKLMNVKVYSKIL